MCSSHIYYFNCNRYLPFYSTENCQIAARSLGYNDDGCDDNNKVDCAVLTLNGVEIKPFEVFIVDGKERGLAFIALDVDSCDVAVIIYVV